MPSWRMATVTRSRTSPSTSKPSQHPAIDQFIDAVWLEDGLARNTLAAYRRDLTLYGQWLAQAHPGVLIEHSSLAEAP